MIPEDKQKLRRTMAGLPGFTTGILHAALG